MGDEGDAQRVWPGAMDSSDRAPAAVVVLLIRSLVSTTAQPLRESRADVELFECRAKVGFAHGHAFGE